MTHTLGDGPIEERYKDQILSVACAIDDWLNPKDKTKETGFVVLMFAFGEAKGGRMNYVSNANREDIVTALKEQLAYFEGMPATQGTA